MEAENNATCTCYAAGTAESLVIADRCWQQRNLNVEVTGAFALNSDLGRYRPFRGLNYFHFCPENENFHNSTKPVIKQVLFRRETKAVNSGGMGLLNKTEFLSFTTPFSTRGRRRAPQTGMQSPVSLAPSFTIDKTRYQS